MEDKELYHFGIKGRNVLLTVGGLTGFTIGLNNTKTAHATKMYNSGASYKEIAKALGISEDQVSGYIQSY